MAYAPAGIRALAACKSSDPSRYVLRGMNALQVAGPIGCGAIDPAVSGAHELFGASRGRGGARRICLRARPPAPARTPRLSSTRTNRARTGRCSAALDTAESRGEVRHALSLPRRCGRGNGRSGQGRAEPRWLTIEATCNALAIAPILAPRVAEVVLAHPKKLRGICAAKVKSDKLDARTLAELLAADLVPRVGDERTRLLRRVVSRRCQLVKQRTARNAISAVLIRNLKGRPPFSDLVGRAGRCSSAELELPIDDRQTVDGSLRQLVFSRRSSR